VNTQMRADTGLEWVGEPSVTVDEVTSSTLIEQDFVSGTHRGWESILIEQDAHGVHIDGRGDSVHIPPHMLSHVIEALQRIDSIEKPPAGTGGRNQNPERNINHATR